MNRILILAFFLVYSFNLHAQELPDSLEVDSVSQAAEFVFQEQADTLQLFAMPILREHVPGNDWPELIQDRLSCVPGNIKLVYNDKVHSFINYFTIRDREYTRMVMKRRALYFPLFEKYLTQYGLPQELKYLSIIESGLNPRAVSRARAVGLWQFMSGTGRYYNLQHNWYFDDRMDPEKSTEAACRYLKDLYTMFGDWELALAAYNTGPGNVKKAIRRSGGKRTFWEIYPNLPRETRSYVPQFIAITYTMNYLPEHNFIETGEEMYMKSDTMLIRNYVHLETLAALSSICLDDIFKLNPALKHPALPAGNSFRLKLPVEAIEKIRQNPSILDSAGRVRRAEMEALAKTEYSSFDGKDKIVYKVRSGDVLGSIAIRHGVKVSDLRRWNNLKSNTIRVGQRLNIWSKSSKAYAQSKSKAAVAPDTSKVLQNGKVYVVQEGDTLWSITRKFTGLTVEKIKSLNNLTNNNIQPGQQLLVSN